MNHLIVAILALIVMFSVLRRQLGGVASITALVALAVVAFFLSSPVLGVVFLAIAAAVAATGLPFLRRLWLSPVIFSVFKKVAPRVSETERMALDAGTVGWDGELFSGRPDWDVLLSNENKGLTEEEQAFVDNQCSVAAGMCNEWDIAMERADLPQEAWEYLKKERFFGMIIPKEYGGLGLSAKAQSAVLQKLAVNEVLMVTVGVPNSLGPGELLLKYGTEDQKNHYLPRLADGREIPCFGLTGPRAGSDATSLPDTGVVCKGMYNGEEVLGLKLNFEKRWITLAPVATVVGLAFRMFDPDNLLGEKSDLGITLALIPRETEGMDIGRRHYPIGSPFMNGPIRGKDVFIPLDFIIGGQDMVGQGWRMLVECLSVGRCITLPSGASGSGRYITGLSGGFTRIRRQFNLPVADMEGVQDPLSRIAGLSYIARSTVGHTANMIDRGEKPAVPSAILKSQLTEFQRQIAMDAMDVHGGKAVTLGPRNYLGLGFSATPVAITVEGANIMTRCLMIFGQGAIRCHPWVLKELAAKDADDVKAFDKAFFGHAGLIAGNAARALSAALYVPTGSNPFDVASAPYAKAVNRFSAAFGLLSDAAMTSLGATLKQREMLSARLGDVLSNLYMISMVLKQWHEGKQVEGEEALMRYSCEFMLYRTEEAISTLLDNLPNRALAVALRLIVMPLGRKWPGPKDDLKRSIARGISTDSPIRSYMIEDTWQTQESGQEENPLAIYNRLLKDNPRAHVIYKTVDKAYAKGELPAIALHPEERFVEAAKRELISAEDAEFMKTYEAEVLAMLTVDDFAFDEPARDQSQVIWHHPEEQKNPAKPISKPLTESKPKAGSASKSTAAGKKAPAKPRSATKASEQTDT